MNDISDLISREEAARRLESLAEKRKGSFSGEAFEFAAKIVRGVPATARWIPVTERLPSEEDTDATGCVLAIEVSDGFARRWEIQGIQNAPEFFTHWMPLPEPPKGA